jgi:glutaredoxin 3
MITIYTTPTCAFCHMAKQYFQQKGVEYAEKDVSVDHAAAKEMVEKSRQLGVPVIDFDGQIVVGFDRPRIDALLAQQQAGS